MRRSPFTAEGTRMGPPVCRTGDPVPRCGMDVWAEGWVLISARHARSSVASLENQCRVYSLDGSVVSEKQESPSSVGG